MGRAHLPVRGLSIIITRPAHSRHHPCRNFSRRPPSAKSHQPLPPATRPPTVRRWRRPNEERPAIRDRPRHGSGQPKARHTEGRERRWLPPRQAGLSTAGTDVTNARETPPVAALPKRRPRRSARTTQAPRPVAGRMCGTTPRPGAVDPPGERPPRASRAFVPEARRDAKPLGMTAEPSELACPDV